jgi:hypothetical protein
VESTALLVAPVTATVVTTAVNTVIIATHIRRGARSMVAAPKTPAAPNSLATAAAHRMMMPDMAKQSALLPMNASAIDATATRPRSAVMTRTVTASRIRPAMPAAVRRRREPASAVALPLGANASTGATPWICRAANAEAATLAMTHAAIAAGTTYGASTHSMRASRDCTIVDGNLPTAKWPMTIPATEPTAPPRNPTSAASANMSPTIIRRSPPRARIVEIAGRRWAIAILMAL